MRTPGEANRASLTEISSRRKMIKGAWMEYTFPPLDGESTWAHDKKDLKVFAHYFVNIPEA
jgi:hypothetical protein